MTTQDYSNVWETTEERATRYNEHISCVVVPLDQSAYSLASMTLTDVLVSEKVDTDVCYQSIFTALQRVETWMYGYCTSFAKPLA